MEDFWFYVNSATPMIIQDQWSVINGILMDNEIIWCSYVVYPYGKNGTTYTRETKELERDD